MPKVGLKLWSTNTGAYAAEAERLHAAGECDYLELFVEPGSSGTLSCWRRLHDDCGIPFVIHNAHAARGFNLASAAAAARNLEIYAETRAFADGLEAEHVIFHGGIDGAVEETVRQLKALGEPRALIENKPFVPLPNPLGLRFCRGATAEELARIIEGAGCGFCLDVGHAVCSANSQGLEPYAFVAELARRFRPVMFHLSDVLDMSSPYDVHPHLGTGSLDIPRLCRDVFPADARISIETVKDSSADLDDFRRDVKCLCGDFGIIS